MVEVFVLGGGTPTPTEFRFGSAHALRIGDEVLMFDCGPAAPHKLVKAGLYPTQVDNLFFTHHHFDHAGSNADFMQNAEVIAHKNARANIVRNDQTGAPRVVFSDETAVFLGGVEVQARHVGRGHTNGDAVIYFPDLGAVHTGDLFIWGQRLDGSALAPFWDFGNGGSAAEWPATLDKLLALDFDTVIPGHGPILTKDEVRTFRRNLQTVLDRVQGQIEAGATRDNIASRIDTNDLGWPLAPVRLQDVYDELTAAR